MSELLAGIDVGDVYLDNRCLDCTDGVMDRYRCVGVGSGVEDNTVISETHILNTSYYLPFYIRLKILELDCLESLFQCLVKLLEGLVPVNAGLPCSQKVEVGAVDDLDFHNV